MEGRSLKMGCDVEDDCCDNVLYDPEDSKNKSESTEDPSKEIVRILKKSGDTEGTEMTVADLARSERNESTEDDPSKEIAGDTERFEMAVADLARSKSNELIEDSKILTRTTVADPTTDVVAWPPALLKEVTEAAATMRSRRMQKEVDKNLVNQRVISIHMELKEKIAREPES